MLASINVKRKACTWYYKICIHKHTIETIFLSITVLYLYEKNLIKLPKPLKHTAV